MIPRPTEQDVNPYFFTYIDQVPGDDPGGALRPQLTEALELFSGISEEQSLRRYEAGKWSIRQLLNHVTDTERAFAFRMLWFSRGFETALPGYDQNVAAAGAEADGVLWAAHVEEFRTVRLSTISLYENMPAAGWKRSGIANGKSITVGALAYIVPGHVAHHLKVLRERYL
jgi:hypothetical protein